MLKSPIVSINHESISQGDFYTEYVLIFCGRCGGLVVSALDSRSNGLGLSPGQGTALCSWVRHFTSKCLSPPRCINIYTGKFTDGGNPAMD